jgi:hypothetical protein
MTLSTFLTQVKLKSNRSIKHSQHHIGYDGYFSAIIIFFVDVYKFIYKLRLLSRKFIGSTSKFPTGRENNMK